MGRFLKTGKGVIILRGRFAGHKAVIVKTFDEGTTSRPYPHALVAGVERYPLKVTKAMSKQTVLKRSRVKPFLKVINYNHMMPTRYVMDHLNLRNTVTVDSLRKGKKPTTRRAVKKMFQERYLAGQNKWLFSKLRF